MVQKREKGENTNNNTEIGRAFFISCPKLQSAHPQIELPPQNQTDAAYMKKFPLFMRLFQKIKQI